MVRRASRAGKGGFCRVRQFKAFLYKKKQLKSQRSSSGRADAVELGRDKRWQAGGMRGSLQGAAGSMRGRLLAITHAARLLTAH